MYFTNEQKKICLNKFYEHNITKKIIDKLSKNEMIFKLKQNKLELQNMFCNESMYGNFSLYEINGMIDMDAEIIETNNKEINIKYHESDDSDSDNNDNDSD